MNEFFRCLLRSNPFAGNAVRGSADATIHVQAVHEHEIQEVVMHAERVRTNHGSQRLVIWGEAGTGKSHLLARLSQWGDREGRAHCRIFRSLPSDPVSISGHVAASILQQMSRGCQDGAQSTALGRVVRKAVELAVADLPEQAQPYRAGQARAALLRLVERRLLDRARGQDTLAVCDVLFRYFLARDRGAAVSALRRLGGGAGYPFQAATPESIVTALAELSSFDGRIMILGFDQLEELSASQLRALVCFAEAIADRASNLLVILSGRQQAVPEDAGSGRGTDEACRSLDVSWNWIRLSRIGKTAARQVLEARLRRFMEPFLTLTAVREQVEQDALFPLASEWFEEHIQHSSEFCTREVMLWAAERWRQQQSDLEDLGGAAWFARFRQGRSPEARSPAARSLAVISSREPVGERGSLVIATALVPASERQASALVASIRPCALAAAPCRPSTAKRSEIFVEFGAWSVTAVNLAVLLMFLLWWPSVRPHDSPSLALGRPTTTADSAWSTPNDLAIGAVSPQENREEQQTPLEASHDAEHIATFATPTASRPRADAARDGISSAAGHVRAGPPRPGSQGAEVAGSQGTVTSASRGPVVSHVIASQTAVVAAKPANSLGLAKPAGGLTSATVADAVASLHPPNRVSATNPAHGDAPAESAGSPTNRVKRSTVPVGSPLHASKDSRTASTTRPITVVEDGEIDRLLKEAWGLIDRGDHGPGRLRLTEARKLSRADPRADFSLGLLDAMIDQDWKSAEEHFLECLRCDQENVPSLNNLAVAQVHNRDVDGALSHWKKILDQSAAATEVVQNLGWVRHLVEQDSIRKKTSQLKLLETLYADAAVATENSFDVKTGFHMMALSLPDGNLLGWADARKMRGAPLAAEPASGTALPAERTPVAGPNPMAPYGGMNPGRVGGGVFDPRNGSYYPPNAAPWPGGAGGAGLVPNPSLPPYRRLGRPGGL